MPGCILDHLVVTSPTLAAGARAPVQLGEIEEMSRGDLRWLITIPEDGGVPLGGAVPALIEWGSDRHPTAALPDLGLLLTQLEVFHPDPARVTRLLSAIGLDAPLVVVPPGGAPVPHLVAHVDTPHGPRRLPSSGPPSTTSL